MSDWLPPDVERVLAAEKNREPLPDEVVDAAWLAVQRRLTPSAPSETNESPAAEGGAESSLAARLLTLGSGVLLGVLGTLAYERATTSAPPAVLSPAPRIVIVNATPSAAPAPTVPAPATSARVPNPLPAPSGSLTESGLAGERALIDRARAALARGDAAAAERAVGLHRSRFPEGQLSEEREAIAIRALRATGRAQEAKQREEDFVRAYPDSVFSPSLSTDGGQR